MHVRRLGTKYLLASIVLLAASIACGAWSVFMFARLSIVVGATLHESEATLDLSSRAATLLEREDDELLRAMMDRGGSAPPALAAQRRQFDEVFAQLRGVLSGAEERAAGEELGRLVEAYRVATDELLRADEPATASARYHAVVNALLRKAVVECGAIREANFREMQAAGVRARDEASRATFVVAGVALVSFLVSIAVARHLTITVVRPVLALTKSVEAIAEGKFGTRVEVESHDELGRLGRGFNRMAEVLDEFRRSNLGEVLRAKKNLEATLEALPDAVVVIDPEEKVDAMNGPARALLDREGPRGVWRDLALPEPASRALALALGGHNERTRADLRQSFTVSSNGAAQRLLPMAVPVRVAAGGGCGAVLVLYDVTEFARLDELRSEVVAVASHELKTPLTAIRMNLLLLGETVTGLAPRQREMLETALSGCEELATLTERFLDVTRIEAGQLELTFELTDVHELLAPILQRYRSRCEDAGLSLSVRESEPARSVRVDIARIETVLSNVLGNAVKYTPKGGTISLDVHPSAADGGVRIVVSDTGTGIPEELQARVFEKFFRVEHVREAGTRKPRGAGLGLYLCKQILDAHGGAIRVSSARPRGTRVEVVLPARG